MHVGSQADPDALGKLSNISSFKPALPTSWQIGVRAGAVAGAIGSSGGPGVSLLGLVEVVNLYL